MKANTLNVRVCTDSKFCKSTVYASRSTGKEWGWTQAPISTNKPLGAPTYNDSFSQTDSQAIWGSTLLESQNAPLVLLLLLLPPLELLLELLEEELELLLELLLPLDLDPDLERDLDLPAPAPPARLAVVGAAIFRSLLSLPLTYEPPSLCLSPFRKLFKSPFLNRLLFSLQKSNRLFQGKHPRLRRLIRIRSSLPQLSARVRVRAGPPTHPFLEHDTVNVFVSLSTPANLGVSWELGRVRQCLVGRRRPQLEVECVARPFTRSSCSLYTLYAIVL